MTPEERSALIDAEIDRVQYERWEFEECIAAHHAKRGSCQVPGLDEVEEPCDACVAVRERAEFLQVQPAQQLKTHLLTNVSASP